MSNENIKIAVVVDPEQGLGFLANTVATIGIGIGACNSSLGGVTLTDADGREIKNSCSLPVPILQANPVAMQDVLTRASKLQEKGEELLVIAFPDFARSLHSFEDYQKEFPKRQIQDEEIKGVGLLGSEKAIKSLTGSLKLLR